MRIAFVVMSFPRLSTTFTLDPDALAERLPHLTNHPEARAEFGRAGRAHAEENFNPQKANDRLVQVYQDLVSGRLPGPE